MVFYYIKSKLQHFNSNFTKTSKTISDDYRGDNPLKPRSRIGRRLIPKRLASQINHNHCRMVVTVKTLLPATFANLISTTLIKTYIQHNLALQLKGITTKFRTIFWAAMLPVCWYFRIERVPFSGRLHLIFRSPIIAKQGPQLTADQYVDFLEGKLNLEREMDKHARAGVNKVLPSTHDMTFRVASIIRKLGQGMHDVLGLKRDFNIVAYERDNKSCPVWTVGLRTNDILNSSYHRGYSIKHLEGCEWKVLVVDAIKPNASFAHTCNIIHITTKLLDICSDEELAYVIAHEMGHAIGRHHMDICMWLLPQRICLTAALIVMSILPHHFPD